MTKVLEVRGKAVSGGKQPLICTPLVGRSKEAILAELAKVIAKKPDIIEWRVDFFEDVGNVNQVIDIASKIKQIADGTPLLFTRRSINEGGEPISLSEDEVVKLYSAVCECKSVDIIDYEMSKPIEHVRQLRRVSLESDTKMIMSYHNFQETPALDNLNQRFLQAENQGADIAKVAIMPNNLEDVLTLLTATLKSSERLKIPLISMSMGGYGSLSRMFGWVFGSAVTFAVGASSSAPGQVPIEDLNTVIGIIHKSISGGDKDKRNIQKSVYESI